MSSDPCPRCNTQHSELCPKKDEECLACIVWNQVNPHAGACVYASCGCKCNGKGHYGEICDAYHRRHFQIQLPTFQSDATNEQDPQRQYNMKDKTLPIIITTDSRAHYQHPTSTIPLFFNLN